MCDNESIFCSQKDDAVDIIRDPLRADVIVLATPCYFSSMSAQLKTLIDRCLAAYRQMGGKEFYFIVTAAEDKPALERTMDGLKGLTDCVPGAKVKGRIYGANAWQRGEIEGNPALEEAYEMGRKA